MFRSDADRLRGAAWDTLGNALHAEEMALAMCPVQHRVYPDDYADVVLCDGDEPGGSAHRAAMCAVRSARVTYDLAMAVYHDTVAAVIRAAAAAAVPVTDEGTYDVAAQTSARRARLAADALVPTQGWHI